MCESLATKQVVVLQRWTIAVGQDFGEEKKVVEGLEREDSRNREQR